MPIVIPSALETGVIPSPFETGVIPGPFETGVIPSPFDSLRSLRVNFVEESALHAVVLFGGLK